MRVTNKKLEQLIIYSLFVLAILNIGDAFSTFMAIESGMGEETNPVMNLLIGEGMELFLLLKFVISATLLYLGLVLNKNRGIKSKKKDFLAKHRKLVSVIVLGAFGMTIIVYAVIVINNLKIVWG